MTQLVKLNDVVNSYFKQCFPGFQKYPVGLLPDAKARLNPRSAGNGRG